MKLRHALALSLAIGAPLWLRQHQVERHLARWARERDQYLSDYGEGLNKEMETYVKELNKSLREAFA